MESVWLQDICFGLKLDLQLGNNLLELLAIQQTFCYVKRIEIVGNLYAIHALQSFVHILLSRRQVQELCHGLQLLCIGIRVEGNIIACIIL